MHSDFSIHKRTGSIYFDLHSAYCALPRELEPPRSTRFHLVFSAAMRRPCGIRETRAGGKASAPADLLHKIPPGSASPLDQWPLSRKSRIGGYMSAHHEARRSRSSAETIIPAFPLLPPRAEAEADPCSLYPYGQGRRCRASGQLFMTRGAHFRAMMGVTTRLSAVKGWRKCAEI